MLHADTTQPESTLRLEHVKARPDLKVVESGSEWGARIDRSHPSRSAKVRLVDIVRDGMPRRGLGEEVNLWRMRNQRHLWRGAAKVLLARVLRQHRTWGGLWLTLVRSDGTEVRLGLASLELVTTAGANFIVDAWQNIVELETAKYHGIGTGSTTPVIGNTTMNSESTTALNPACLS